MLDYVIKTIPHKSQRYETSGDYWREKHRVHIRVSDLQDKDMEFILMCHELIEHYLAEKNKIKISDIDSFDKKFEAERARGLHGNDEPGDDPKAPYYEYHQLATGIERMLAAILKVDWQEYDGKVVNL